MNYNYHLFFRTYFLIIQEKFLNVTTSLKSRILNQIIGVTL